MDTLAQSTDFPQLFREYILSSAQQALTQVQSSAEWVTTPDERDEILYALEFALDSSEASSLGFSLLEKLAPQMEQAGYRDDWIPYLQKGIARSRQEQNVAMEAGLSLQLGILQQLLANFDEAHRLFESSLQGFQQIGDQRHQAQVLNRQAQVLRSQQKPSEANQLAQAALDLLEPKDAERALSYATLGGISYDDGNYENALDYYEQALTIRQNEDNPRQIAWNLTNIGATLKRLERHTEAMARYAEAIDLLDDASDPVLKGVATMNLGNVYMELDEPRTALGMYEQAKQPLQETKSEWYLAMLYHNVGSAKHQLKEWQDAEEAYLTSIELHRKHGNITLMVDSMDDLASTYMAQNKHEQATVFLQAALRELKKMQIESGHNKLQSTLTNRLQDVQDHLTG